MSRHLPVLIVALPLAGALVVPVLGLLSARLARLLALGALLLAHLASLAALRTVLATGALRYELGGWAPPWGIEYVVDALSGGMAVLVSFMAFLGAVYAGPSLAGRTPMGAAAYHALHLLLAAGLLGIVVTGDAFNLYVFLEIAAISAYALLAGGGARAAVAVFRYLLVGTVAASFYLLGVGHLYALTGTLNMADLAARLPAVGEGHAVAAALGLVVVGLAIKTALFPLHGWLPDAYAEAPAPAAAFVSSVMGKVTAYVLLRFLFFIFDAGGLAGRALDALALAAAAAIVVGSVMALAQRDLRRLLAYSSVGQMGFVVLGLALGNAAGLVGALLHVANHAVLKACLFMAVGNVALRTGTTELAGWAGIAPRLPLTMAALTAAAISMIGLPPAGGFFSKWYLIAGALERGAWPLVVVIVGGSLVTAAYVFRVLEIVYFRQPVASAPALEHVSNGPLANAGAGFGEAPLAMLIPTLVLGAAVFGLAFFNQALVRGVLAPAIAGVGR